ncbi:murein L,D-transpeptidase catalytic domain family protein [Fulvimonas soli]|uniref:L,D-transpeptidase-like protein n=1 Tax=Fulvimonas soli TaxID=155197 RepID=A0A316IKR6_9GAMM|nr:L,D-transpeptidase-like protein [Fulvimonas soli]
MRNKYLALPVALALLASVSGKDAAAADAAGAAPSASRSRIPAEPSGDGLPAATQLARLAPAADPRVLDLALAAMRCAQAGGVGRDARRLAVIDYSRSSLRPRLWVFDLAADRLLYEEVVAHGQGSGGDVPTRFSNDDNSHASSLGLFVTRDTYVGHNGYSLRLQGLDPGFNDAAMARAIVMHGAAYVNPAAGRQMGRLGRSWGCPALRSAVARPIIDVMKGGQFVFSYYPDQAWLARSALLKCAAARGKAAVTAERRGTARNGSA